MRTIPSDGMHDLANDRNMQPFAEARKQPAWKGGCRDYSPYHFAWNLVSNARS
jgi:hypothetical protein